MGSLATIIAAISEDVVLSLAAAGYPTLCPLQDGTAAGILVGTAAAYEQVSPPRIIFEPIGSKFFTPEYYSASAERHTTEREKEGAMRTIAAEDVQFAVRCWGAAGTGNPVDDYDVTRGLYHQVRASIHKLMPGAYAIDETGKFTTGSNVVRAGREYVFGVTFFTPVLASLLPYDRDLAYAPDAVGTEGTDHLVIGTGAGATEPGCE